MLNKTLYVEANILELRKVVIYAVHYNYAKKL